MPSKDLVPLSSVQKSVGKYKFELIKDKAKHHGAKTPTYLWRVSLFAAKGAGPVFIDIKHKLDPPEHTIEYHNALKKGVEKNIERARVSRRNSRLMRITPTAFAAFTGVSWLWQEAGWLGVGGLCAACVGGLAFVGSRLAGRTITDPAPVRRRELTQERLDDALRAIKELRPVGKDGDDYGASVQVYGAGAVRVETDYVRATEVEFAFPPGAPGTYSSLLKKRGLLAAQLGVKEVQLDVRRAGGEHEVSLWLADSDPLDGEPEPSPLLVDRRTSIWEPARLGTDSRGMEAQIGLIWESVYISGTPRKGKSNILRVIASYAALDPYLDFMAINFKGSKDLKPLQPFALRYVAGKSEEDARKALETLRDLNRMSDARQKQLAELDDDICPDAKLTPEIVELLNMRPILVLIDELELGINAFTDSKERDEFIELLSTVARGGPSAGIIFVVASQRPDGESVPTKFRDVVSSKIAVQCANTDSSNLVLGKSASASGWDASKLPFQEGRAARCIVSQNGEFRVLKTDFINIPDFRKICEKGMQLRAAAGTLRPEGEEVKTETIIDRIIRELEKEDNLSPTELSRRLGFVDAEGNGKTSELDKALRGSSLRSYNGGKRLGGRVYRLEDARATAG